MYRSIQLFLLLGFLLASAATTALAADPWLTFEPQGKANGKRVVLISGDEEYRSEESLPQLAKILSARHGFQCTVLFAINPTDGTINPAETHNIPGLEALDSADLMVILTRFRDLPDDQMRHLVRYIEAGKPIVALRTATHALQLKASPTYAKYSWNAPDGGFGRTVLGETWISHHGKHGVQSTRAIIRKAFADHPIFRGIDPKDLWSPTDVYTARLPLRPEFDVLADGAVLSGMQSTDPPVEGLLNNPMMPVIWINAKSHIFVTTMGTSEDLLLPGMRRLLVNACFWATGLEAKIDAKSSVDLVGDYHPRPFKFDGHAKGVLPGSLY